MEEIKYNVILSRRRSLSIIVRPDKSVTVRAPLGTPLRSIEKFVRSKSPWIFKHINSEPGIKLSGNEKNYINGENFLFLGRIYKLSKVVSDDHFVKLNEEFIIVGQKNPGNTLTTKYLMERWYYMMAGRILTDKLKEVISRYSNYRFEPAGLAIRKLKSRWGSCNIRGKITLNSELLKVEMKLIEYVIIHELCHLKIHNHGPDFHKLMGELLPEYKSLRKRLGKYITR